MEIGKCDSCNKTKPIVNKRYKLCNDCNQNRLNPNHVEEKKVKQIEYNNKQRDKAKEKIKSKIFVDQSFPLQIKPKKDVNQLSLKEAANKKKLRQIYAAIDEDREPICSGCGRSDVPLSHSHIISRHQNKSLESDPENIVYDCLSMGDRQGCHDIWEHGKQKEKLIKLLNYEERMAYIYRKDRLLWNRLKAKE